MNIHIMKTVSKGYLHSQCGPISEVSLLIRFMYIEIRTTSKILKVWLPLPERPGIQHFLWCIYIEGLDSSLIVKYCRVQ